MSIPIPIPIPRTRKGVTIFFIVCLAASLIGAAVVFALWAIDQDKLSKNGQPDFNTIDISDLENGTIVKGTIVLSFDTFAEEYETDYGVRSSDKSERLFYVIPVFDVDSEGYLTVKYVLSYNAGPSDFATMDKIVEQTYSDTAESTTLELKNGLLTDMPGDLKKLYYEWADSPEFYENGSFIDWCVEYNIFGTTDKGEIRSRIVPYCLNKTATAGTSLDGVWACLIIAAVIAAGLLAMKLFNKPMKGVDGPDDNLF